jgi:hypothetical protein
MSFYFDTFYGSTYPVYIYGYNGIPEGGSAGNSVNTGGTASIGGQPLNGNN